MELNYFGALRLRHYIYYDNFFNLNFNIHYIYFDHFVNLYVKFLNFLKRHRIIRCYGPLSEGVV